MIFNSMCPFKEGASARNFYKHSYYLAISTLRGIESKLRCTDFKRVFLLILTPFSLLVSVSHFAFKFTCNLAQRSLLKVYVVVHETLSS